MNKVWKVIRAIVSVLLLLAVGVPALVYVLLSLSGVQNEIRAITERELSARVGAEVSIGRLSIRPFKRVMLSDLSLTLEGTGDTVASIGRVSAGIELIRLMRSGEIVVDYALVDGLDLRVWRSDSASPLNVQPILDHLRSDRPRNTDSHFELKINTVVVRRAAASYDVLSAPEAADNRFDANHIRISDLTVNAFIPEISNSRVLVDLDHLSARERCGFELRSLTARVAAADSVVAVRSLGIELGGTRLYFDSIAAPMHGISADHPMALATGAGSRLCLSDFAPFVPALGDVSLCLDADLRAEYTGDSLAIEHLTLEGEGLEVRGRAYAAGLRCRDSLELAVPALRISLDGFRLAQASGSALPRKASALLSRLQPIDFAIVARSGARTGTATISGSGLEASIGYRKAGRKMRVESELTLDDFDLAPFAPESGLGCVSASITATGETGRTLTGTIQADVVRAQWRGYTYADLRLRVDRPTPDRAEATVSLNDPNATALVYAFLENTDGVPHISATASLANVSLEALGLPDIKPGYRSGAKLIVEVAGDNVDDLTGYVDVTDLRWTDSRNQGLRIPRLNVAASRDSVQPMLTVRSDLLSGSICGRYAFSSLPGQLKSLAASVVPALFGPSAPGTEGGAPNDFLFDFTLNSTEDISRFFGLPLSVVYPAAITGHLNSGAGSGAVEIDAPYIVHGDKIYRDNVVYAHADGCAGRSMAYLTTQFPTKKGDMVVAATLSGADNRIDTDIDWTMQRRIPLNGSLGISTVLRGLIPAEAASLVPLDATVTFKPGTINFGYDTWSIRSADISTGPRGIDVGGLRLDAGDQHILIDGTVSPNPADTLTVDLANVSLLPIFETLEIDKAMLSGRATGTFKGASLLENDRFFECPALHVDSIGYNRCTIGDAEILARWDTRKQSFFLDADITGQGNRRSHIAGDIFPFSESLDLSFHADSVPVGFLKPFMEAFAKDISGHASGDCRLFGTFSEIDLTGDVWADSVSMAVDFTNTVYTTSDSVHMRPGRIIVPSATMRDRDGHTATISGWVNHVFFKQPSYRFDVTDARNLLCYNVGRASNPDWYGTIYANGRAAVYGEPGVVNIEADMSTGSGSTFTFVLTDRLDAADYSFLEFRDATPDSLRRVEQVMADEPLIVREIMNRLQKAEEDEPSDYVMHLSVDITPDAELVLVMDEAAGDEIRATGSGHMAMDYDSSDEDLRIRGAYTVASGSYHFTLQDIIIKDFTIKEGSTINFDGDPYAARADLRAYYATTANLSDLDESFLQDREVTRTKVPVHALMKVRGDIRQPEIGFDLEFPTLTDDTYRKVRSIVSTNEMMNRQIIYLLALNRFYTPDYMDTTKGSELFSVASSTLSSQLSSLLGKLSDNWTIAPNLRSDKGNFSDVEVDVALSSRLLNNRLLLNGNLGYRDKSRNTNQFVGDFDIEYLLNPRGTWRLKAYNRYNDANYYLRSAATTQGVGLMFRRDFDNFFKWLRRKPAAAEPAAAPSAE